uniref:Uncharacterized protein n=1 Tax=Lepeophtheirus salmonis TaxID=72036 RepID=A0A0K2UTN5_LEPSM
MLLYLKKKKKKKDPSLSPPGLAISLNY